MKTLTPAPPKRSPDEAMREFEYACRIWLACMQLDDRYMATQMMVDIANEIEFKPNRPPRSDVFPSYLMPLPEPPQ